MRLSKDTARELLNLNPTGLVDQAIADRQFEVIVEAFNHLINGNSYIYIADEVGLGKTYIAIGISSLIRHFSENPETFNDLIIVPKKNLQIKWQKEIKHFINHNYLLKDNRVKSVTGTPIGIIGNDQLLEKFRLINRNIPSYNLYRISSFSMGSHENFDWAAEFRCFPESALLLSRYHKSWDDSFKRRLYALLMNINTPEIDCLIVDEVHNFKHGREGQVSQRNEVMTRFMGNKLEQDQDIYNLFPELVPKIKKLARKVIFLSATPIDKGLYQLRNQLDIFLPDHNFCDLPSDELDEKLKGSLSDFLIRGVMNINLKGTEYSRNMYRHEHRRGNVNSAEIGTPMRLTDDKLALITGLVQYKTMKELSMKNNPSFEIGLLAGFESFTPKPKNQDPEFYGQIQTDQKEAEDGHLIQKLAESFTKEFGKSMPHLKQDSLIKELMDKMIKQEKALVFTRRIASVVEMESKLLEEYTIFLFKKIEAFGKNNKNARLQILTKAYKEQSQRKDIEFILGLVSQRINILKYEFLFNASKGITSSKELQKVLIQLYDEPSEDQYWISNNIELEKFQSLVQKHIGRKNRIDSGLVDLSLNLLEKSFEHLTNDSDPDDTFENEEQINIEDSNTPYFFEDFFKGKGKSYKKATYDNPWYELNLLLLNNEFQLFNIDLEKLNKYQQITENKKEAYLFKGEQDNYEAVLMDQSYENHHIKRERLNSTTFVTKLLLESCRVEFDCWMELKKDWPKERFIESINSLVEIIKGIFRNGSGAIPAYLAWSTNNFTLTLLQLLETEFQFVLNEVRTVISDFDRIIASNFPDASKIKYTLYNQLPVHGVSGHHKVNVSKIAAQFRMPGYPYVLFATDILKEGEDLHTYCSSVYHYGIAWNPSDMEQRTGRIDRIGSKCYYDLKAQQEDTIPFNRKLQVFFPYLSDTLEVNQVAKVFRGMNQFIDTFYDFTETRNSEIQAGIGEIIKVIPDQITTKLESKYDIRHFRRVSKNDDQLIIKPCIGFDLNELIAKLNSFNDFIIASHVDRKDEYSIADPVSLRIKGLIYNELKERQCPFKINLVNDLMPGEFVYEIISSITNRRNLTRGALTAIRDKFPDNTLFELNSVLFARTFISINESNESVLKALEDLVFEADELEEIYGKGDSNYFEAM